MASALTEILSRSSTVIWTADRALRLVSVEAPGARHDGAGPLPGIPLEQLFVAAGLGNGPIQAHQRALQGKPARFEFELEGCYWVGRVQPLWGSSAEINGVSAVLLDHTERIFTERSLRLSEQSYRSLIEEAPFAIARATVSGQLLQVNRAMVEMLGYESEQELLIQSLNSEIFPDPRSYEEFVSNLRQSGPLQGLETTWRRRDGQSISIGLAGRAALDEFGTVSYLEVIAENITERKLLEHQLRQAQKIQAVGQLAGGIAHDFNNLLTIINGQIQMALSEISPHHPVRERLEDVEAAATRATKLTRQLLTFGRFQKMEARVVNINSIVSGMMQMLVRLIGTAVELKFAPAPDLNYVKADSAQLEQVIMNLVLNAKDATPDGGSLTISTGNVKIGGTLAPGSKVVPPGEYVTLAVIDKGQGMSPETLARIFEPFFTTKKAGEGTGLGLATVFSIVKQNHGYVVAESELGAGSSFTIYLPEVLSPARRDSPSSALSVRGGSETILFAEDEEIIRKFASSFLTGLGYRVLCACDGLEAVALSKKHPAIDLLITDILMPRMGGRELAEDLSRSIPGLKVLFISGYSADPALRDVIRELKAQFMQKPFPSMPVFAKSIRDVLDRV